MFETVIVDVPAARAIEILTDLVGFDTVSSKSNLALIHYVRDFLARRGVTAEILPNEIGDKANLFATIGPARAQGVVLSGHTDVVPVTDQAWTSDPFTLTRRGDRLYGRGAADMKAFIACALAALDHHDPAALLQPIHLAFSYDEEVGCLGSPALIERIGDRIERPVVTIVGEPSRMRIIGSHKSVLYYRVDVTGVPAHSSATHLGVSANAIAIPLMNRLLEIAGALRTGEDQDPDFQPSFSTLTVGLMNGGTAPNILAGDASFTFDLRALPQMDPARILAPFWDAVEAARAANPDSTIGVERLAYVPAFVKVADGEAERLVRAIGGDNLDMVAGSFGAEAGQFQAAGFPTVICGPGSIDQAHQADEYIEVSEIDRCMRFMAKLHARLSRTPAGTVRP